MDTLAELVAMRGVPKQIRSDNGPEFVAKALQSWLESVGVGTLYIEPGSPWQNGYAESFNSRLRDEFLATGEFEGLEDARQLTRQWRGESPTTITALIARWATRHPPDSLPVLPPFGLRPHFGSTDQKTQIPFNPNLHNPWYRTLKQVISSS